MPATHDRLTRSFHELFLALPSTPVMTVEEVKNLMVVGKSARLLRRGDRVALHDLNPDRDEGTAVVDRVRSSSGRTVLVETVEAGSFLVRGSRLVLASRGHAGGKLDQQSPVEVQQSKSLPGVDCVCIVAPEGTAHESYGP